MSSESAPVFDAIVVGSGMSGGWAAKELTERGFKVLLLERGRELVHRHDYPTEGKAAWELPYRGQVPEEIAERDHAVQKKCYAFTGYTEHFFINDRENPYATPDDAPFEWIRGDQLGGRSLLWQRQCYRWSELDFAANRRDGHGVDWPIRYADIAPWYDHVETFAGISGSREGLPQLPDGQFQPPYAMNCVETEVGKRIARRFPERKLIIGRTAHLTDPTDEQRALGRGRCMNRNECQRGCSFGAFFSSLSATLPAAQRTGNLTTITDAIVESVAYDETAGRATGVRVIDRRTRTGRFYAGRVVFLCASTLGTAQIMLNSRSERFPNGIANSSGALGRYLMDHLGGIASIGVVPGFLDRYDSGRRPTRCYIPRYTNVTTEDERFLRGYAFQCGAERPGWTRGPTVPGVGTVLKEQLRDPGPWRFSVSGFGEMLPDARNRVWLDEKKTDMWGLPLLNIDCRHRENDLRMMAAIAADAAAMLAAIGLEDIRTYSGGVAPGLLVHEMGTARMGRDPASSVLNAHNQAHDVPNLFVTDGAAMASSACQNPSLTYMALTARASAAAADMLKAGTL